MKITHILFKNHIGRMIERNWYSRGKIKVISTPTEEIIKNQGYEVIDVKKFLNPPKKEEKEVVIQELELFNKSLGKVVSQAQNFAFYTFRISYVGLYNKELPKDSNHPDYKCEPLYIHKSNEVLIDGLQQAKVLTNTVEIRKEIPEILIEEEKKLNVSEDLHTETKNKIKLCCMFEATQKVLPKRKDPLKPMWVFPRDYGIPESKKIELLCKNLTALCEQTGNNVQNKSVIFDGFFSTPIEAHQKKIQLEASSELLITTRKKLKALAEPNLTINYPLPELHPFDCTVGLSPYHFYVMQDSYPPGTYSKWPYIQIAFIHLNHNKVKNIIEKELTESQIQGRSLLIGFNIALAEARAVFGSNIRKLSEPIVVPLIQTDGKMFHFTIFQLNTLDLDRNSKIKNIFWNSQRIPLYSKCQYQGGRPVLEGYNPDVIRRLITFYNIE